jgi:hypothetical protein
MTLAPTPGAPIATGVLIAAAKLFGHLLGAAPTNPSQPQQHFHRRENGIPNRKENLRLWIKHDLLEVVKEE